MFQASYSMLYLAVVCPKSYLRLSVVVKLVALFSGLCIWQAGLHRAEGANQIAG